MLRLLVLGNSRNESVPEAVEHLKAFVEGRAEIVEIDLTGHRDLSGIEADLAVVFGGDGTILASARRLFGNPMAVIGVKFGKFGFLAEYRAEEMEEALESILAGDYIERRRMRMVCRVKRADGRVETCPALNDCLIGSARLSRMVTVHLSVDDEYATTYAGDGVLVATPVGSTAHSLAAGGPIVSPMLDAFILTPIAPHALTNRALVLPPMRRITVEVDRADAVGTLSVDGQVDFNLDPGDQVEIVRAAEPFRLWRTGHRNWYEILRTRLNWRGTPNYDA
jgi:NAD+ kinase